LTWTQDIVTDLVAGSLLLIIGWASKELCIDLRRTKPLSKVLGTLADNSKHVIIVIPKLYSLETRKLKQPRNDVEFIQWPMDLALFAEGDAKAMMYLYNLLLDSGKKQSTLEIKSDVELTGKEKEEGLICIGAGSNSITKELLNVINPPINFEQQTIQTSGQTIQLFGTSILDRRTQEKWVSDPQYDYGLIARLKNQKTNADILILAGLGPSGTTSTSYFISTHWRQIYNHLKMEKAFDKNFEVLLRTRNTDPTDITLIKISTI
jgi:hypothetical protein